MVSGASVPLCQSQSFYIFIWIDKSFNKSLFILYGVIFYLGLWVIFSIFVYLQASVSLKRLRVFLSHEELQEDSVEHKVVADCEWMVFTMFLVFFLILSLQIFECNTFPLPSSKQVQTASLWRTQFSAGPEVNHQHSRSMFQYSSENLFFLRK